MSFIKNTLKIIYDAIPFKKNIFNLLKIFWTPSENIYKHLHFKDIIDVYIDDHHSFKMKHHGYVVENDIFWTGLTGGWEKVSLSLWIELSKKSNVIFDVGANTGIYSLISKCINDKSEVYSFEPVTRVYEKLEINKQLNNYDFQIVPLAASNFSGTANIYDTNSEHTYSVTVNQNMNSLNEEVFLTEIRTTTLDDFIVTNKIGKIDLIKIDVETHEPEVLEGYKKHLIIHEPSILIEILSDEIGRRVEEIVSPLNYLYFNIGESNGIRKVNNITKSDHFNYLLCSNDTARFLKLL